MKEIKLYPGMDTAEFVIAFNEMGFDIMCGLDLHHESKLYGMVFFERKEVKKKEISWWKRQLRSFVLWLES